MRMKVLKRDLIKVTAAAFFGFMLRMLAEPPTFSPPFPHCDCSVGGPLLQPTPASTKRASRDSVLQLVEPFQPSTRFEVISYDYFNKTSIYNNFNDDPGMQFLKHQKNDVQDMMQQAATLINSGKSVAWHLQKLRNGYRRIDPLRGQEFILDMEVDHSDSSSGSEVHRLHLVKPFSSAQLISKTKINNNQTIHLILTTSRADERFHRFMDNFEKACLQTKDSVYLLIVLFTGEGPSSGQLVSAVQSTMNLLRKKYSHARMRVIQTVKPFSRAVGLDLGARDLPQDALLFFCDVDVTFSSKFLTRCRENAVQGKQVFYPMVFAQYKPDIAKKYSPPEKVTSMLAINKYTGLLVLTSGLHAMFWLGWKLVSRKACA